MKKVLWVGDAGCDSGFAKCTHEILETVRKEFEVAVCGLNYRGDPNKYAHLYNMYPAYVPGGDLFGVARLVELIEKEKPDVVVIQNDPWNIPAYMAELAPFKNAPPVVGHIAIDGKNPRGKALNKLAHVVYWTDFAKNGAEAMGCTVPGTVIPLGVDLTNFKPFDREKARKQIGLPIPEGAWIVGNMGRNQPRKRMDLTIQYFMKWVKQYQIEDAYLYLHVSPTGDKGIDCDQLAHYYGMKPGHLILAIPEVFHGATELGVARTLQSWNVQINTAQGEGWGLPVMEGMAVGTPQIVPECGALQEWPKGAAHIVPCHAECITVYPVNSLGALMDPDEAVLALHRHYIDRGYCEEQAAKGLELVARPEYRWSNIGERWVEVLKGV